ncbi:thioredoxin family protein [Planctomycetes bacterium K23_9]|uniref:Thioredoxin n=1 Tax=Stieleria marina TaxID=1930275 RepID=A0A517NM17_9BACT|nr:Thioredoxin [Planctomycetes bacterium K23_9]
MAYKSFLSERGLGGRLFSSSLITMTVICAAIFCMQAGCRSSDVSNAALADAEMPMPDQNAPEAVASERPSYAQSNDGPTNADNKNIQLASARLNQSSDEANRVAPSSKLVTLRTLGAEDNFQQIVSDAPGVVLVDFYADWCGPCRKQGKVLHGLESFAAQNNAQIIKVDVDQHKAIAKQFAVASLPTLVVIKNGKVVDQKVGLTSESRLRSMLQ